MKIRRVLATAVALAVTTPAVLLSVTPAAADTKPAAPSQTQTQNKQSKPSIKELEKAAAEAQKAYDKAVKAKADAHVKLEETLAALKSTHPLAVAAKAAEQAAKDAAAAKTTADQAVTDAKAVVDALPETATEEERTAAANALSEAEATAKTAAAAKTAADTKSAEAEEAVTDARVEAFRVYGVVSRALTDALAAKTAADQALAKAIKEAEEGQECEPELDLTADVTGLPSTLVAGTTTAFSIRVTNGSDRHMDEIIAYAGVHATDRSGLKDTGEFFRLQWSTASSPKWQNINKHNYIDAIGALKPGAHADVKLRLTVDKAAPAGNGVAFIAADFFNEDGSCGGAPGADMYEFDVKAAGAKPGKPADAKPVTTEKPGKNGTGLEPQGTTSSTPVKTGANGNLAATGSSSATPSIALAGGAAVALGAAAMFVVRRRKAGSDA
ncbi:LAETG motif-containing sortase-dependent surface protein [Streptomyces sp. 43Y-GA-1]|uniref:LAETG motif-containing sortase-dependent surface protein n=1 Tax=Streptomyces sp. 43Y-GA-1 TaxID=2939435 RepID=UPI0020BFD85E|nr:LAETG motif-containing sortase-dependent surface protein [Streptomyces sp. 43Y-GA-1]MCL6291108.1 LPXTG cell wall anchor domain-containing protein [Streptomyces sp. 43Y-GA-1]